MVNPLTEFTKNNITEIVLGLAIGIILVLLMDLNFQESMTVIILGPLLALVFNKLLESIIPNVKTQRIALVIIGVIGLLFLVQHFQLGVFDLDNVNTQSFIEVETQPQIAGIKLPIEITGALIAAVGKLPFLIIFTIIIGYLLINFPVVGWILLAVIGIPALIVLGTGVFLIAKNFTLIIILIGGYSVLRLIFRKPIEKQAKKK